MLDLFELQNRFIYHPPIDGQQEKYEELRAKGLELAQLIANHCPESREQSLAVRKVEEAIFWAIASIARNP